MKKAIVDFFKYAPVESGLIFIAIGLTMLIFLLNKKKTIRFWDSSVMEWKAHVTYLSLMMMCFSFGLVLIIKNI